MKDEEDVKQDTVDQDALYSRMAAEFGTPLARLAAAYESDPNQQQDLLQELHFSLWRSLATFHNQCSLRTWVYRVAHNTASSYVRRQSRLRRMREVSLEDLDELVHESDFEQLVDGEAAYRLLRVLIDRLKPIDREVFLLYLEGLKAAEISDVVGISPSNVAQKIHRARKHLKQHFQNGGSHDQNR
jgi:RNA polymerase sigma-70 factor, ECF subfamily